MTYGIQTQSQQYGAFSDDSGIYAQRDRVAVYDVPDGVPEYLVSEMRPSITAGLLNTRQAGFGAYPDTNAFGREDLHGHGFDDGEEHFDDGGYGPPPEEDPYAGHDPHHLPLQPLDQFVEQRQIQPLAPEPPGHFSLARRRTAEGDGPDSMADRTLTALAVPPAQPAPPAAPVWLGHTYAPGHRVGLPWRGRIIPGTVTHLEGYNVGVRYDDGQHAVEEPSAIQPLHQWS